MSDIVLSSKRKINLFDRVIQSVVIMVNMNKMNRAIDEHLEVIRRCEKDEQKAAQENILREIVFVKYQYDIMQRQMYELRLSYPDEILDNINTTDKTERLKLQKAFLEMEYDRITKTRFKSREELKYSLIIISSVISIIKQNIKDEGKSQRYNKVIKVSENIDSKIQTGEYTEAMYKELFEDINEYVDYINDNYDISKLPTDERQLIEFVIETMIKGIESDIDKHMYEYNLIINICSSSYRYFKIVDKIFEKLQNIYDESIEKEIINLKDYRKMYKEIYDSKIKTMVNDVHRTIKTEDEYLEYSKLLANSEYEELDKFLTERAYYSTKSEYVKKLLASELKIEEEPATEVIEEVNEVAQEVEEVKVKKPRRGKALKKPEVIRKYKAEA
ncbi:MAG: hypothetical protein N2749_00335 [Clostridia bacterium]|nr:hypothetical protein [Clostridia bacterium]